MSIFARSDVMGVAVPVEAGGCGEIHSRPVSDGQPAEHFELTCDKCATALKDDPQWAGSSGDLPRTPDEQNKDEAESKRGLISRKEDLVSGIAEGLSKGLQNLTTCRECGKMSPSGMKFCGECGNQLGAPKKASESDDDKSATQAQLKQRLDAGEGDGDAEGGADEGENLNSLNVRTLRKRARDVGLDESGTKPELVKRLEAQGK
jgi:hypothetical protein